MYEPGSESSMKGGCRRTQTRSGAAVILLLLFLQFHSAASPRAYASTPPAEPSSHRFMCGGVKLDGAHAQASPHGLPQLGNGSISIAFDGSFPVQWQNYAQTLFDVVYPQIRGIYGYPSNTITITVRYNATAGGWSYYVPRTNSIDIGILPNVNPPNTNDPIWDNTFTHELIHGFHDALWLSASWNEEGMTEATTEIVAENILGTRNITVSGYRPANILRRYDECSYLGKDVVGGTTYSGNIGRGDRAYIFYSLAASMFWILTTELSTDPTNPYDFLRRLNTRLYTIGASNPNIDDAAFKAAVNYVAGSTLVEGSSPDIWISNQPISYVQGSAGPQLGVYSWEPENPYYLRAFVFSRVVNQTNPWNTRENPIPGVSVTIQVFDWSGFQVLPSLIGLTDSSGDTGWLPLSSYPLPFGAYRIVATATGGGLSSPLTSVTYARGTGTLWSISGADTSVYGVVIDSSGRPVLIPVFVTTGGTLLILQNGAFAVQPSSTATRSEFTLTDGLLITKIVAKPNPYTRVVWFSIGFDFYLSASPQQYVVQGGSSYITVTVALTGGVTQLVYLSVSGLPSGASASLTPASGNPTFTSTCSISTSSSTPRGSYRITVTGTGGGLTRTTAFSLNVTPAPPFDFSLSNSGGITATQGSSGSNTITVTLVSGTTQSVSLSVSGLPFSTSFSPGSGNPTFTSTCTISTSLSTPTGSYAITVTGTGGGLTRTTTFTLTVNAVTTIWITTATTTSSTSTSYVSLTFSSTQRLNVTSTATSPSTSFLTTATTLVSGSVSTTYTSRTTFYVTSTIPSTTVLTSTVRSNSTSTEVSKTGTTIVTWLFTSSRTVSYTVYVNVTAQLTYIELYLQRIVSTLVDWFNEITRIVQNVFVTATVRDTVVRVEPGLGSTVAGVFSGSDPVGFMMTGNIYDDSGIGFIYAHRIPPRILFRSTDATRINQATGAPTWYGYSHLVTVGGRAANPTTRYYEDNGLAPLRVVVNANGTISILRGSTLQLNVQLSSISQSNDYFVMQVLSDGARKVVILWGIQQWGTYAAGVYFDGRWFADMPSMTAAWYIIRWQDLNSNGIPDYPGEFSIIASGI